MDRREEAAVAFFSAVERSRAQTPELTPIIRDCLHGLTLMDWREDRQQLSYELTGFPETSELPQHRVLKARLEWQDHTVPFKFFKDLDRSLRRSRGEAPEETTYMCREPLTEILGLRQTGLIHRLGETRVEPAGRSGQSRTAERILIVDASTFRKATENLESYLAELASSRYSLIRYGNAVNDIWSHYRSVLDERLKEMGLLSHLGAIESGIGSQNPQEWRSALFASRNLLRAIADYLWRDSRNEYELLPGDRNGHLDVSPNRYVNRLSAYLHQKSVHGTTGSQLRSSLEVLSAATRALVGSQSSAHDEISREIALSIVISTYVLIGQFATFTDLAPILLYSPADE